MNPRGDQSPSNVGAIITELASSGFLNGIDSKKMAVIVVSGD